MDFAIGVEAIHINVSQLQLEIESVSLSLHWLNRQKSHPYWKDILCNPQ